MANNENNIEEAIVNHYHTLNYILTKLEDLSDKTKLSKSFDLLKYAIADAFEPVDEWFKDLEFAELYRLYEFSVSESGFKKTQKQADIINLKQITNNDIQLSKSILLLNAKYSSRKFENSLEEAKKQLNLKTKLKTKPETINSIPNNGSEIENICKERGIEIIEITKNEIIIKSTTNANIGALRKNTNLKITIR